MERKYVVCFGYKLQKSDDFVKRWMVAVDIPPFKTVAVFDRMRISCQSKRGEEQFF
jgi:hypothetical protein